MKDFKKVKFNELTKIGVYMKYLTFFRFNISVYNKVLNSFQC